MSFTQSFTYVLALRALSIVLKVSVMLPVVALVIPRTGETNGPDSELSKYFEMMSLHSLVAIAGSHLCIGAFLSTDLREMVICLLCSSAFNFCFCREVGFGADPWVPFVIAAYERLL